MFEYKGSFTNKNPEYSGMRIGNYTYGKPLIYGWTHECEIGKFCSLADYVTLFGGYEHNATWVSTYPFSDYPRIFDKAKNIAGHPATKGPLVIGNDVWVGNGACILSGVNVGDGAIIGARAVVTKNVPAYAIVVGSPARIIRYRFTQEQIVKLLKIRWWDWDIEKIREHVDLIFTPDIDKFLKIFAD